MSARSGREHGRWTKRRRGGFTNAVLLIGVAIIGAIALLSLIETGGFDPGAMVAKPVASKSSGSKKSKPPVLFPSRELPVVVETILAEQSTLPDGGRAELELRQAIVKMDSAAAAKLLAELDTAIVADLLIDQRERDLARILEAADSSYAAEWVLALRSAIDSRRREAVLAASALARMPDTPVSELQDETAAGVDSSGTGTAADPDSSSEDTSLENPTGGEVIPPSAENGSSATVFDPRPPGSNIA